MKLSRMSEDQLARFRLKLDVLAKSAETLARGLADAKRDSRTGLGFLGDRGDAWTQLFNAAEALLVAQKAIEAAHGCVIAQERMNEARARAKAAREADNG